MDESDIPELIDEVISNPIRVTEEWDGDVKAFTARVEKYGIEKMEVRVFPPSHPQAGRVQSAWPNTGSAIRRYEDGDWWRYDDGEWIKITR